MRAFEDIIRLSAERLISRPSRGWLTPRRSRAIVTCALALGFVLVIVWACALAYLLYRLGAWLFS